MSNYHRSTRWAGVPSRSPGSSMSSDTAANKTSLNAALSVANTASTSSSPPPAAGSSTATSRGKLTVSSFSQRQQQQPSQATYFQAGSENAASVTSFGHASGSSSVAAASALHSTQDAEPGSVPGRNQAQALPSDSSPQPQVDLSSTLTPDPAAGWDSYRNDQLVAYPAAIGAQSYSNAAARGTQASSGHTEPGSQEAAERTTSDDRAQENSSNGSTAQVGGESPLRRGPSSAALASRRLADALENDDVGALYSAYRDEWSPEPINTAPDPSQPMQQRRPPSASSVLPASEVHRSGAGVTFFSAGDEHSQQQQQQQHVSRGLASSGSSRVSLQGISEVSAGSAAAGAAASQAQTADTDVPPPRPPPPTDSNLAVGTGQVPMSQSMLVNNIGGSGGGGENIQAGPGNRQFQGPVSRNRNPILASDNGVIHGLNKAPSNGTLLNSDFQNRSTGRAQGRTEEEVAYSEAYFKKGYNVNGAGNHANHASMPPTAFLSSPTSQSGTMVTINTASGHTANLAERSGTSTPTIPSKVSTFMPSTAGQPSSGAANMNGGHLGVGNHGYHGPSSVTAMSRSYGSREAVAASRQSGTSTPRYIAAGERLSPPGKTYYENTDDYPASPVAGGNTAAPIDMYRTDPTMVDVIPSANGDPTGSSEFPPPPHLSQESLLSGGRSAPVPAPNGLLHHRYDSSFDGAGTVALDVVQRDRSRDLSSSPGAPLAGSPQLVGYVSPVTRINHMRQESAPAGPLLSSTPTSLSSAASSTMHQRGSSHPPASSGSSQSGVNSTRASASASSRAPWQRKHLYRLCQSSSSQSPLLLSIPPKTLDRLGLFLNRFLYRVMAEAKSLASAFNYCSHHEVLTAIMLIAPATVAEGCIGAAVKARLAYSMSANAARFRTSKTHRCCLVLPVARIHQWLVGMATAGCVSECAAVYLAAATEHLGHLITVRALAESRKPRPSISEEGQQLNGDGGRSLKRDSLTSSSLQTLSVETLDYAVSCSADIWSIVQQHPFLVTPKAVPVSASASSAAALSSALGEARHMHDASNVSLSSLMSGAQIGGGDRDSLRSTQRAQSVASNVTSSSAVTSPMNTRASSSRTTSQVSGSDIFQFPASPAATVESKEKLMEAIEQVSLDMTTPGQSASPYVHSPLPRRRSVQTGGTSSSVILPQSPMLVHRKLPSWSRDAVDVLFHFASSHRCVGPALEQRVQLFSSYVKSTKTLPSMHDWVRLSTTLAQYRCCPFVDGGDVLHAAQLLLPGVIAPPYALRPFAGWLHGTPEELGESAEASLCRLRTDELFVALHNASRASVPHLLRLYSGDNVLNSQGLTLLMVACMDGNAHLVEYLAHLKQDQLNITVPRPRKTCPAAMPSIRGWTALHFAVAKQHFNIAKLLLVAGADVEGGVVQMYTSQDVSACITHSPLQLACAAGHVSMVNLLLDYHADPFLAPPGQRLQQDDISAFLSSAFAVASTHGQQDVMNALLSRPIQSSGQDKISLTEVLAEADGAQSGEDSVRHLRASAMQEALFLAAEHGYIDLALVLRSHNIPWTLHSWGEAIDSAYHNSTRGQLLQQLLTDYNTVIDTEMSTPFCHDTLPLLFSILRQNVEMSHQVAVVLQTCYGQRILPSMGLVQQPPGGSQLDVSWVNNPEMADIVFIVEGRQFFAHRIMLIKASNRFQAILSASPASQAGRMTIDLPNISFNVLELVIFYIYTGGVGLEIPKHIMAQDLLRAARFFELWRLHQHTEVLTANMLNVDSICELYNFTKTHEAPILREACESYFLAHLTQVCRKPPFRKLLSETGKEFIETLRSLIVLRLKQRGRASAQQSFITAC